MLWASIHSATLVQYKIYTMTWDRTRKQGSDHLPCYENDLITREIFLKVLGFVCLFFRGIFFNSGFNETMLRIFVTSERIKDQKATWDPLFQKRHKMVSFFKSAFPDLIAQLPSAFNATLMVKKWPLNNLEDFKTTFIHTCWDFWILLQHSWFIVIQISSLHPLPSWQQYEKCNII